MVNISVSFSKLEISQFKVSMREVTHGPSFGLLQTFNKMFCLCCFRERPLALYAFTNNSELQERLSSEVQSGGYVINDIIAHYGSKSNFEIFIQLFQPFQMFSNFFIQLFELIQIFHSNFHSISYHLSVNTLPFGGIGNSGMGAYHGKYSFDAFSHSKAYLNKNQSMEFLHS